MNSTELYIAAGEALVEWGKTHKEGCILTLDGTSIICCRVPDGRNIAGNNLYVSGFEISHGMEQNRWNSIGSALHELYCKELTWPKHQKH